MIQIDAFGDDVAPKNPGFELGQCKLLFDALINAPVEKRDLALEVFLVIKVAIAYESSSGNTFDRIHFFDTMIQSTFRGAQQSRARVK